jgi:hypothetical protein
LESSWLSTLTARIWTLSFCCFVNKLFSFPSCSMQNGHQ